MINEKLLKQKLHEKSILENKLLKAQRSNEYYRVRIFTNDLYLLDCEIEEIQNL